MTKDAKGTKDIQAYCMKCKVQRKMVNAKLVTKVVKGTTRYMMMGNCVNCDCKMCKFISKP